MPRLSLVESSCANTATFANVPLIRQQVRDVTVVEFTTPSLMDALVLDEMTIYMERLVSEENRMLVVLDFSEVRYISSQAVGLLMTLHRAITKYHGKLVICGVSATLQQLLKITRLDKVLTLRPTQREAVRHCSNQV